MWPIERVLAMASMALVERGRAVTWARRVCSETAFVARTAMAGVQAAPTAITASSLAPLIGRLAVVFSDDAGSVPSLAAFDQLCSRHFQHGEVRDAWEDVQCAQRQWDDALLRADAVARVAHAPPADAVGQAAVSGAVATPDARGALPRLDGSNAVVRGSDGALVRLGEVAGGHDSILLSMNRHNA